MEEKIIVTLTTWSKRIGNIPAVLDTIYAQTRKPDLIVLNLAYDEVIPEVVHKYIEQHSVEVNRVEDTKVYKKLIPTLKKYPNDCVIAIDDDWLYPQGMIAEFVEMHRRFPNNPISGNKEVVCGIQCHCGCASLTKASFFGDYLDMIDNDVISNCPSDDMVYSYLSTLSGHPYRRTKNSYFMNMKPYGAVEGYSDNSQYDPVGPTFEYMIKRFGAIENLMKLYISDESLGELINEIHVKGIRYYEQKKERETEDRIYASYSFRIGHAILKPFRWLKNIIKR